jgi:signal transduction histidine kinase
VEYRRRVVASLLAVYLAFALASLVTPHGPYAQIGLVTTPIYAFVLLGSRAARVAVVASTAIIVSVPLLREQPAVVHLLGFDPALEVDPLSVVWYRVAVKTLSLLALMVLVDRFHGVLRDALIARIVAQRKTEREMRERQRLEREIAGVSDRERRRLGQDLHDGVCQQVTAALLRCQTLERRLHRGGTLSEADFEPLASVLAQAIDEAHGVARGLSPLEPDPEALAPALRALARRMQDTAGLRCEFTSAGDVRVADPQAAQHLYRIAQEALSNAVRHAKASRILVEFRGSDSELTLHVEDDGAGMPPERRAGGMGLRTMAYRAQLLEGGLIVAPAPGGGTRVTCRVPRSAGGLAVQQGSGGDRWMPAT